MHGGIISVAAGWWGTLGSTARWWRRGRWATAASPGRGTCWSRAASGGATNPPLLHCLLSDHRLISVSLGLTLIRTVASLTAATSGVCRVTTTRRNIHSHVSINWVILSGVGKLYCQRRIMDINDDNNFPNMLSLGWVLLDLLEHPPAHIQHI